MLRVPSWAAVLYMFAFRVHSSFAFNSSLLASRIEPVEWLARNGRIHFYAAIHAKTSLTSRVTCSAMEGEEVRPGDSIPIK